MRSRRDMDVSFTNVLEGARQYFQGLPAPNTTTPSEGRIYDEQSSSGNSVSAEDGRESNSSKISEAYWSTGGDLRTIEPYPPQPTRVEVPDTRPNDGGSNRPDSPASLTSLTEMQPPSRPHSSRQDPQQMEPSNSNSPAPVYQQLNNVSRPSSYPRPAEMLNTNSHYSMATSERPPSTPIVAQRTQYYPRYHHPDITKSAPVPFSQNSIYQSPQTSISSATEPPRPTPIIEPESSPAHQVPSHSSAYQPTHHPAGAYRLNRPLQQLQQQQQHHHNQQQPQQQQQQHHQQQQQQQSPTDISSMHSSSNPCSPRHAQQSHIPSPHNHPGHIPSPHLPVPSVAPPSSLSSAHALPQQPNHHTSRVNPTHVTTSNSTYSTSRVALSNPYQNQGSVATTNQNHHHHHQQQMLPPPSGYQQSVSPHDLNRHENSPQRQSPHVSVVHNTISPQNLTNFQPHSPTYPPPPQPPQPPHPYGGHRATYPTPYPTSSYHSYQKTPHTNVYPQASRSYGQLPVAGPTPQPPPTLNPPSASPSNDANGVSYSHHHASSKLSSYNGVDPKRTVIPASQANSHGSYRMPVNVQRNTNTHNLPITAVSSYHSNRGSRETVAKVQAIPRPRTQLVPNTSVSTAPLVMSPRMPEYHQERFPIATSAGPNYTAYSSQYRNYATTVAPSHHGSTSTTVTSIVNDTRPSQPSAVTVHTRPSSDTSRRSMYTTQRLDNYSYKEYSYANSSSSQGSQGSQPVSTVAPRQPVQMNGLPIRKRESPLDLSVKTVKTSADSTARDDFDASDKVSSSSLGTSRNRMLPPSQPGVTPYGSYDGRNSNGARNPTPSLRPATPQMPVCAPKVDFLPDFNNAPLRHQSNHQPESNLRRSTSQQIYVPPQHSSNTPLPHMSTFKKTSLPSTPVYENKPGLTSYPAMIEAPRQQIRYPTANPVQARPPTLQDYESKYLDSRGKYPHDRNSMKRPGEPFYLPGGSNSNKHPRIDTWKIAIDKEIQQRLTAAQAIHEQHKRHEMTLPSPLPNGTLVSPGYPHQIPQQRPENSSQQNPNRYPMPICDKKNNSEEKSRESMMTYSSHAMSKSPSSQVSQGLLQPVCQAPYPYRPSQRSLHAQQPHDIPSNTGADKRVLSLLRNSLESKQQREEQLNSQQPLLVNHSQPSFQNKVVAPVEPKTNIGRHNLSPFTAASLLERNSNTPPHYKFHVPRAVDSITQEMPRSLYGSRVNSSASLPAGKEALLGPRDLEIHRDKDDSLAAILAAKIRTKAELKQVGTGQFTSKPVFLPSQDVADSERAASTSTPQSAASSAGSPPKLTREKTPSLLPRRRLFSRSEEENMPVAATVPAPAAIVPAASVVSARTSGFRSSSETSVFDFRESDSEGEMPVLERQTLEEMRRDRKQLSKVQPPVSLNDAMCVAMASSEDLVKIELKENDKVPELDPFWAATCDKFIEQLRNGGEKKRGRRKKIEEPEETSKESESKIQIQITPENIKKEIDEDDAMMSNQNKNSDASGVEKMDPNKVELTIKKELEDDEGECNNSEHDSDELPLIKRASKKKAKKDGDDSDGDDIIPKKRQIKRGSRIKLESSSGSDSSSEDSDGSGEFGHGSSVAHRLRARKRSGTGSIETEGMKLRSREMLPQKGKHEKESKTPMKNTAVQKPKPKPLFGDGSDFRPGWEEEVYVYKKSLRMPTRLINVSKPSRFHRLSTSLPDLDPGSPALSVSMDSTDVCLQKRDSDLESNCSFGKIEDEEATSSTTISLPPKTRQTRSDTNSIVDVLAKKVGSSKKDTKKKLKEKLEKSGSKVISKGSNEPELLPTPSLTPLLTNESKSKTTGKSLNKNNKTANPINMIDSYLLGYFRKETVNNFRDTFKNNHALPNEFSTYVLKSRTRTETRVLKKQATIREVFGEDRPASAPPMQNHAGDTSQDDDSQTETKESLLGKPRTLRQKVVSRLRNASILRSHKAIINSKRHLLTVQRRKVLLKSLTEKKLKNLKKESKDGKKTGEPDQEADAVADELDADNNDETERPSKKKLKLRSGRRKFRSGFDYIRKKKKPMKKDDTVVPKERKRQVILRPNAECVADIQTEIRTWVIKKGVGETILHRAARLGYTDVTAYCLEKLNNAPSPKDNAGYTPLHEACSRGHLEIAKLLLAYGANVSESANGGIRPLHEAAENGATELVRLLLSYGADPLLATYSGQTPLMLAVDTDAYSIIEQHLGDVQGHSTTSWTFRGPSSIFDPEETGYDPMAEVPASNPEPELSEIEMEISEINLPVLFSLTNDPDKWVLQSDLMAALRVKSRDALLRQINPKAPSGPPTVAHRDVMKELKLHDFLEQSRCCHLLSAGERINVRASKVALIKYNDKVKSLLNVEHVVINLS